MERQYHRSGNLRLKTVILNATAVTCMGMERHLKGMVSMTQYNTVPGEAGVCNSEVSSDR